MIRGSIVVSISACHAEDPGSIPGRGGKHCLPQRTARAVLCGAHELPASPPTIGTATLTVLCGPRAAATCRLAHPPVARRTLAQFPAAALNTPMQRDGPGTGRGPWRARVARGTAAHLGPPRCAHCCGAPWAGLLHQHVDPLALYQRPVRATAPCGCAPPPPCPPSPSRPSLLPM